MNIVFLTRSLPFHHLGGMEQICWDFAREFRKAGHSVVVLTTRSANLPPDSMQQGVRVLCVDAPGGRYSLAWWFRSRRAYHGRLAADADIVMSVGGGARALGWFARKNRHPAFVVQVHGTSWGEFQSKLRERRVSGLLKSPRNLLGMVEDLAYRRFDAAIAVSEAVAQDMRCSPTRLVIGDLPVHLIPNGVAEDSFAFDRALRVAHRGRLGLGEEARVVLSASRLHPQKGVMEGIAAFESAAAQNPDLQFVIAGSGPDEARLRARAAASPASARIHLVGNIPRDTLRGWLSAADIFLFTTKRVEGLPLNILEALAAGLPVIASAHVVQPQFNAVAVDPQRPDQVAAAILSAAGAATPSRASRLPAQFGLSAASRAYLDLFEKLKLAAASSPDA